jgi:DNA-binding NarL/FixJ family response regulator
MMNRIRLLVVDDEARVRQGLQMRLALEPDLEVVGEAADGETALHLALLLRPEVVVIDLLMPDMDGLQAIRLLRLATPASGILAVSIRDGMAVRRETAAAGAAAFVAKQDGPDHLLAAIRDIAARQRRHEITQD